MRTRAAVAVAAGKPLEIMEVNLDDPKEGEVLIEIKATGICHTDEFTLSGADPEGIFPSILGHEGAGVVVKCGPGVKSLKPGDKNPLDAISAELVEVRVEFEPSDAKEVVFNIRDIMIEYDVQKQELSVAGHRAPAPLRGGKQRLVIYCDRTGAEVFASDGLCYVPMPFNTKPDNKRLFFETRGGAAKVNALEVHELRSAWHPK